jgi:hypothetical protein
VTVASEKAPNDLEQRALAAQAALEESLAERNRLWEELHRVKAEVREEEHFRGLYEQLIHSASWRITAPLRTAKWFVLELPRRARRFFASRPRS